MSVSDSGRAAAVIRRLRSQYGRPDWWQGDAEEVMIGAILTQQTRWENVDTAISQLKGEGICSIRGVHEAPVGQVEAAVRCTGFFRVKTRRLKSLASHVIRHYGSVEMMSMQETSRLRDALLSINGVGEETADSILCYALGRCTFVIDAYTERICRCAGITGSRSDLKHLFESVLPDDLRAYRESHAHMVMFGKEFCAGKRCDECWIRNLRG